MPEDRHNVKSADRTLAVLELLAQRGSAGWAEVLDTLKIPRSSAHSLLNTLTASNWVTQDERTKQYSLGLRAWEVGRSYRGHRSVRELAIPHMVRLRDDLNETVQLATLDGGDCLYLHVEESLRPMRLVSSVGARLSAHATGLGKALLSQLPPESLKERVASFDFERLTPNTISDPTTLAKAIDAARVAGFATDDEEYVSGCRCVAVPLRLGSGEPVALSVTMPSSRTSGMWPNDIHSALATAAEEIEKEVHI